MPNKIVWLSILLVVSFSGLGQRCKDLSIHSHNDYEHKIAFWDAYEAGATSIEVDVFLKNDTLFATHSEEAIIPGKDIEAFYLRPIQKVMEDTLASPRNIQLLIDIKSEPYTTLDALVQLLEKYPNITGNEKVSMVISGNRPKPEEYIHYPDYILFDYQSLEELSEKGLWKKVALISLPFYAYSEWDGKSEITAKEIAKIKAVVNQAKDFGKPFRFWATPDTPLSWKTLADLGICFINTDRPSECAEYFKKPKKGHD